MEVKYIIQSKYYNGDDYADKFDTLQEVAETLIELEKQDRIWVKDENRIDTKQISVTTEEA